MLPTITLRPFKPSDADDFLECVGDSQVTRYCRIETLRSREEALKYIEEVAIPHPWFRAISVEGRAVGFVYVSPGEPSTPFQHKGDISYALAHQYWGRGIVAQALKMVVSCVFGEFPQLVRLEAMVDARNTGSLKALEKAGFVKEGLLRKYYFGKGEIKDLYVYSFLSSDHKPE